MSVTVKLLLAAALILSIGLPFGVFIAGERSRGRYKRALCLNLLMFFGTMLGAGLVMSAGNTAAAAETAAQTAAQATGALAAGMETAGGATGMGYLAAALSTGLACIGGGIAVSAAASAALGAISEDGSILGKSLIFVGLAEGVCLYGLIISFMILGRL